MKKKLEALYRKWNRRKYVSPDPLQFLYDYPDSADREVVGLVAASLAYGRVAQIIKSVAAVCRLMGASPARYVQTAQIHELEQAFEGFVHRFANAASMTALVSGMGEIIRNDGSLNACFLRGMNADDETVLPGLRFLAAGIREAAHGDPGHLVPNPEKKSACKRLNLFLRWMVRKDAVDPGGWKGVPQSMLIIPLDVHMHRFGKSAGMTRRNQADMRAALEITDGFRKLSPDDPVKYDFAITRYGIRQELSPGDLFSEYSAPVNSPLDTSDT